ncbi:monovalent cation/proton antiporter, MnhG/PhaG subunit [Deinococcus proteolyticus MRP]|uniref:Monovalent cation/proton antiporter, MnhG/PhaG subunit n=1 Tax=Deinococcus proteolyticus (strain ATCC 35074 / DSM 20540 / JCM 6276 / NBRC 101906 / NCIMB 13154 / VKM Ac-1939 / CCM 2703 / MRP) TaxID=693977 RepID=F0RJ48_DEIPM|nr:MULTISPECIES: monovalent cation/H(+) antiporter subunit G [Deinococcus]ADY25456.1 monovalent cation/proton antiporter, MnhG/PhaG subunit [Deinococcus proteolyticus MRP]MCY1701577.1 monovalent cation/H(+) antiporter subunit G [Deinococcus sp. SL84]
MNLQDWDINLWRDIPVLIGSIFVLAAAVGVLRFPDLYTRLHASSKLVTLGSAGIYLGVAADFMDPTAFTRLLAVLLFQFLTTPLSAYLIAQASYLRGLPAYLSQPDKGQADEWNVFGAAQDFSRRTAAQPVQAQSHAQAAAQTQALDDAHAQAGPG